MGTYSKGLQSFLSRRNIWNVWGCVLALAQRACLEMGLLLYKVTVMGNINSSHKHCFIRILPATSISYCPCLIFFREDVYMSKHALDYIFPSFSFFRLMGQKALLDIKLTVKASNLFSSINLMQVQAGQKHGRCQKTFS